MREKKYRLWIGRDGKPAVLQFLDEDAKPEEVVEMAAILKDAMTNGHVLVVGPEVEVVSA